MTQVGDRSESMRYTVAYEVTCDNGKSGALARSEDVVGVSLPHSGYGTMQQGLTLRKAILSEHFLENLRKQVQWVADEVGCP